MISSEEFTEEYRAHFRHTVKVLSLRTRNAAEAEDIAQAAWGRAWERRQQFAGSSLFHTWVCKIAFNEFLTRLRRLERVTFCALDFAPDIHDSHDIDSVILVNSILLACGQRRGQLLNRVYMLGYTPKELAVEAGITENGMKQRLLRARLIAKQGRRIPEK